MQKLRAALDSYSWLPLVLSGGGIAVVTALATWIAAETQDFTSNYRSILEGEIEEAQKSVRQVQDSLILLSMVANGKREISPDVIRQFDQNMLDLLEKYESLTGLLPETEEEFNNYRKSMVVLSSSVGKLTGPLNAKRFVESVSEWYSAKKKFDQKVEAARISFFTAIVMIFR